MDETRYKTVRINFRDEEDFENFRKWETLLIMGGDDLAGELSEMFREAMVDKLEFWQATWGREVDFDAIVDSNGLRNRIVGMFGRDLSRAELQKVREKVLTRGEDFFEGTSGGSKVFRYDASKALPKIKRYLGK